MVTYTAAHTAIIIVIMTNLRILILQDHQLVLDQNLQLQHLLSDQCFGELWEVDHHLLEVKDCKPLHGGQTIGFDIESSPPVVIGLEEFQRDFLVFSEGLSLHHQVVEVVLQPNDGAFVSLKVHRVTVPGQSKNYCSFEDKVDVHYLLGLFV